MLAKKVPLYTLQLVYAVDSREKDTEKLALLELGAISKTLVKEQDDAVRCVKYLPQVLDVPLKSNYVLFTI